MVSICVTTFHVESSDTPSASPLEEDPPLQWNPAAIQLNEEGNEGNDGKNVKESHQSKIESSNTPSPVSSPIPPSSSPLSLTSKRTVYHIHIKSEGDNNISSPSPFEKIVFKRWSQVQSFDQVK
jgi:hypothetical protein